MVMCGIDFSGLELRVLSHYLYNFDSGAFQKKLLEDDIHTANQQALGLSSRSQAKTFIYAYIYGAGNKRIAEIIGTSDNEAKRIREKFEEILPALKLLNQSARNKFKNVGYIKGLDGRKLLCRAEYSTLNTLIQSAGALLVKQGTIILNDNLVRNGFVWGKDYAMVLHIHDEMQFYVNKEKLEHFKSIASLTFELTQKHFNFRCPLAGEIKVGSNWSETH
jgi:DNA polymerase I-like protein with 3'-5' exonuclease and polymerase domains